MNLVLKTVVKEYIPPEPSPAVELSVVRAATAKQFEYPRISSIWLAAKSSSLVPASAVPRLMV